MNKSEMKSVMESIEKKLQGQKHYTCMAHGNTLAWDVLDEIYKSGQTKFVFNGVHYDITFNPSHTTHGNRSTTSEYVVTRYSAKTMFDADELLAKKEITVRHFHGGKVPMEKMGMQDQPYDFVSQGILMEIINQIYLNSKYNIMIQRHDTGDVTIWVDEKRFNQR